MNTMKKVLSILLVAAVTVGLLAGCKGGVGGSGTGEPTNYTVTVQTAGGMPLADKDVTVYADSSLKDMKGFAKTDENGVATFNLPQYDSYAVTVSGMPKGYVVETYYSFEGTAANICLNSKLVEGESLNGANLGLGDVMYNFSYTLADGTTKQLSDMLAEKKMVFLNFWFSTCGPCATEFPYMEQAYQMYKEDVGVIALSYIDPAQTVANYQASMGLTFDMAACDSTWPGAFGFNNFPSSVVIDRYGVITLIEVGALTSLTPFSGVFAYFTDDNYVQKLCPNGVADVVSQVKPTYTMPTSEEIAAVINRDENTPITYRAESGESAEFTWPFILTEKVLNAKEPEEGQEPEAGEPCLKASNQMMTDSYAILYADVELKKGEAIGFDYLISSELGMDTFVVIVDGEDIFQMSGYDEVEQWKSCYPWVALEDGTYEVALCYLKDSGTDVGDDTVYIKNMRVVPASKIEVPTYLPRQASALAEDGFSYEYVDVVFNKNDGYYHVGTANGPLLLANLMGYSNFNDDQSAWDLSYEGPAKDYYEQLVTYFSYASNSAYSGYCTVNQELMDLLKIVDELAGFDEEDTDEWLRFCCYYEAYGTKQQLEDPIKGLSVHSAYKATLGKNVKTNSFTYNRAILPRGLFAEFIPSRSGVYRITSHNESEQGVDGWIFDENKTELLTYTGDEKNFAVDGEISMVYYMQAGKPYYIDIAFYDIYETGTIYYDIEYLGGSYTMFRRCSPGFFTYDTNATGDAMYHLISGGIDVVLGADGYYYEDLGNGKTGSKIYADFNDLTTIFTAPINTYSYIDEEGNRAEVKGLIDSGFFDFRKNEFDLEILRYLERNDNDVAKTKEYLKELWGEDYDANAELYQLEEIFAGRYHGKGEDLTEEVRGYLRKIIGTGDAKGCVPVDARLAEILQMLMDNNTFENVDHSWTKLCYYFDTLGPNG